MTNEKKTTKRRKLRNFTLDKAADDRLLQIVEETGKSMTVVIEDLLLWRRQFSADIEEFITKQTELQKRSRKAIIEDALVAAAKKK